MTWSGSASTIFTITSAGLVTALTTGTGTATATLGSVSGTDAITIEPPVIVTIAVTPPKTSITQNETKQFHATGTLSDGSTQNLTATATWITGQSSIATIDNSGIVTPGDVGTTTITAASGSVTGTATLKVTSATLTSISIEPDNPSVPLGLTGKLKARGTYSDGTIQEITQQVTWASLQANIAMVDSNGIDTGKRLGTAKISATLDSITQSVTLTVTQSVLVALAVTPSHHYLASGGSMQLTANGTFSDESVKDISGQVAWSVNPPGIATVSSNGTVTANASGRATITGTSGQLSASASVVVDASSIVIVPANSTVRLGSSIQLKANATFADGTISDVTDAVTWAAADTTVAFVTSTGDAAGVGIGTTTISASSGPAHGSATLTVEPAALINYFTRSNTPGGDQTLRITNSGMAGENLCAMIYVFAPDQQLTECCGCQITSNGLLTLSLTTDLTSNPLTGTKLTTGTVQIVPADETSNPNCDPSSFVPAGTLSAWETHLQTDPSSPTITETRSEAVRVRADNLGMLQGECQFIRTLGSGHGTCTCGTGD